MHSNLLALGKAALVLANNACSDIIAFIHHLWLQLGIRGGLDRTDPYTIHGN
jgi:hypothetical protein